MTTTLRERRGGPGPDARFTRDYIINRLRRYAELYGETFTAAAFSPSTAKWRDEPPETIERYYAGDPETGEPWPSLNALKSHFGGSFNAAREAAGLPANKPGPAKRRRAAGSHAPDRTGALGGSTRTIYVERDSGEAKRLQQKVTRLEARVERLRAELESSRAAKRPAKTKVVRERVADDAAITRAVRKVEKRLERAEKRLVEAVERADAADKALRAERQAGTKLAARLERSEATVNTLRAEKREMKERAESAEDAAAASKRMLNAPRVEVREVVRVEESPEAAEVRAAKAETGDAVRFAEEAERRVAAAERRMLEMSEAVTGERRMLTPAEFAELREGGPSGPAVLAQALGDLAKARKAGGKAPLRVALGAVASAAVRWRDRL